jgi:hypothetical protein
VASRLASTSAITWWPAGLQWSSYTAGPPEPLLERNAEAGLGLLEMTFRQRVAEHLYE